MKYSIALILSLLAVAFAAPANIYVDDSYLDYSTIYDYSYDAENEVFENVPIYISFGPSTVDGALVIDFATEDAFGTDIPAVLTNVVSSSEELTDIFELDNINAHKSNSLSVDLTGMTLDEALEFYLQKFQDLNYKITQLEDSNFSIVQLNSKYMVTLIQNGSTIELLINGI